MELVLLEPRHRLVSAVYRKLFQARAAHWLWNERSLKPGDGVVASIPKCGRTWVRFFIGNYLQLTYRPLESFGWNNFTALTPCYRMDPFNGGSPLFNFPKDVPKVIFSHDQEAAIFFRKANLILIGRPFREIAESYYFFHGNRKKPVYFEKSLSEFILDDFPITAFAKRIAEFERAAKLSRKVLFLSYRDLVVDTESAFEKILMALDLEFDEDIFQSAMAASTRENMRAGERNEFGTNGEALHVREKSEHQEIDWAACEYLCASESKVTSGPYGKLFKSEW